MTGLLPGDSYRFNPMTSCQLLTLQEELQALEMQLANPDQPSVPTRILTSVVPFLPSREFIP
jgi:hypothetical protein